jgi:YVTN family beta-propeller protein
MTPAPRRWRRGATALVLLVGTTLAAATPAWAADVQRSEQDGVTIEFSAVPLGDALTAGSDATFTVNLRQGADGPPLRGAAVGGWLGVRDQSAPPAAGTPRCTARAAAFSRGSPLNPPALDLNGYYLVSMNGDASLSVIDPLQGFGGSRLVAAPGLAGPGADWALTPDRRYLVVSEPGAGRVAIIDGSTWRVLHEVPLPQPARLALAPDGKAAWIAYRTAANDDGVALLDLESGAVTARVPTGRGPHDLAFAEGGHVLLVTDREDARVSVIATAARAVVGTVPLAGHPVSIAYGPRAHLAYVAGDAGSLAAIDPTTLKAVAIVRAEPGLGIVRFAPDGRFALATNRKTGQVIVIDSATNEIVQRVDVGGEPDQIVFSDQLVYIRRRQGDALAALPLAQIGKAGQPIAPANVTAGQFALGASGGSVLADAIAQAPGHAAVVVANPADGTLYYYQEGMIAPQSSFDSVGVKPAAVLAADRSLREVAAGRYQTVGRLPHAGFYDAVFYVDSPRLVQCFAVEVRRQPGEHAAPRVAFTTLPDAAHAGQTVAVGFRLFDPDSGAPVPDAGDVTLLTFRQPGDQQAQAHAAPTGDGGYSASFRPLGAGSYYVFVESRSLALQPTTGGLVTVSNAATP